MKIYKEDDNLIISVPLSVPRYNPYMDEPVGIMDNVVGVISGEELGFAYWIDMDYKGKGDQISETFFEYSGEEEEFVCLCKELGIEIYRYPMCSYCGKVIYGSFTLGKKGDMCFDCNNKKESYD